MDITTTNKRKIGVCLIFIFSPFFVFFCLVRANSCWRNCRSPSGDGSLRAVCRRFVALAHRQSRSPSGDGSRRVPRRDPQRTSRLLSAIGCACSPLCIAPSPPGDGSRYEPTPVGDLLRLHACDCPSPSGDGSPVRANSCGDWLRLHAVVILRRLVASSPSGDAPTKYYAKGKLLFLKSLTQASTTTGSYWMPLFV